MPLVHYAKWKKGKKFGPNSLVLDPENYRLDKATGQALSQKQIIEQLVESENVKELAASLIGKGYMPVEDVIIVEESGRKVVVEGNRRVCAFKLLTKPALAPKLSVKAFERLHEKAGDELPRQVYCVIAPNRSEANVYIFSKHADEAFSKRWQSIRQAAFVAGQLHGGATIQDVSDQTGLSRSQILEEVTALDLYRLAGTMPLTSTAKATLTSPNTFPYTALVERIFGAPNIRSLLGVEISEHGIIGIGGTRDKFLKVLGEIFEDVSDGVGDEAATRKYGTNEKALLRIKKLGYKADGNERWKAFEPGKTVPESEKEERTPSPTKTKRSYAKTKQTIDALLPLDLKIEVGTKKLEDMIEEAKRLDISCFYHSGAIFLRCIVETALNAAVDARNCRQAIEANHAKAAMRNKALSVEILLTEAATGRVFDIGLTKDEKRGIHHLTQNGPLSFDMFHLYVHNKFFPATREALAAMRENVLPILRKALAKP